MAESELATRAVDAMAAVRSIAVPPEHPMRHNVRTLKQMAEAVLSEAFRRAHELAFAAEAIVRDCDKEKEATHG